MSLRIGNDCPHWLCLQQSPQCSIQNLLVGDYWATSKPQSFCVVCKKFDRKFIFAGARNPATPSTMRGEPTPHCNRFTSRSSEFPNHREPSGQRCWFEPQRNDLTEVQWSHRSAMISQKCNDLREVQWSQRSATEHGGSIWLQMLICKCKVLLPIKLSHIVLTSPQVIPDSGVNRQVLEIDQCRLRQRETRKMKFKRT